MAPSLRIPGGRKGQGKRGKVYLEAINRPIAGPFHVMLHDMSWHVVNSPHKSERWTLEMRGSVKDVHGLGFLPFLTLHSRSIRENWDARQNWEARERLSMEVTGGRRAVAQEDVKCLSTSVRSRNALGLARMSTAPSSRARC